jgi:hypothetical protein
MRAIWPSMPSIMFPCAARTLFIVIGHLLMVPGLPSGAAGPFARTAKSLQVDSAHCVDGTWHSPCVYFAYPYRGNRIRVAVAVSRSSKIVRSLSLLSLMMGLPFSVVRDNRDVSVVLNVSLIRTSQLLLTSDFFGTLS